MRENYAGKMLIGAFDPSTTSFSFLNEQADLYGFAGALVHKNYCSRYCANVFIGGANDISYMTAGDEQKWALTIMRIKDDGTVDLDPNYPNLFHIIQEEWEDQPSSAPVIDHMHLDDSGVEWLYGSTRAWTEGYQGPSKVYLWKVKLDLDHDPDPNELTCVKLQNSAASDSTYQDQIIGLKPSLVDGKLHGLL